MARAAVAERVLGRLFEISDLMGDLMAYAAREHGMSSARARLLWTLLARGTTSMRDLADRLEVTPRTITGLVDSLEADGWVRRGTHSTDRRVTLISLTPTAITSLGTMEAGYRQLADRLLEGLSDGEARTLLSRLDTVGDRLAEEVAAVADPATAGSAGGP